MTSTERKINKIDAEAFGLVAKISALSLASGGFITEDMMVALRRLKVLKGRLERLEGSALPKAA